MKEDIIVSKAHARYIRVSPRKARKVIDLIRGEKATQALVILANINKGAKSVVQKVLKSAISNAQRNPDILTDELLISKIVAETGPTLKRFRAAAMGRATMIRHRTTHLTIELAQKTKPKQVKIRKKKERLRPLKGTRKH